MSMLEQLEEAGSKLRSLILWLSKDKSGFLASLAFLSAIALGTLSSLLFYTSRPLKDNLQLLLTAVPVFNDTGFSYLLIRAVISGTKTWSGGGRI